jgi:transcriptional regulator with XRE-family HTH domain
MPKRKSPRKSKLRPNKIKAWRKHRGKTQEQLAEALGISVGHLSRIESGEREYMQSLLEAAAEYLETDPASLLMRDPSAPENIWSLWDHASIGERQQIETYAAFIVKKKAV